MVSDFRIAVHDHCACVDIIIVFWALLVEEFQWQLHDKIFWIIVDDLSGSFRLFILLLFVMIRIFHRFFLDRFFFDGFLLRVYFTKLMNILISLGRSDLHLMSPAFYMLPILIEMVVAN